MAERGTFKVNVKANIESTKRKTVFYDLKPDTTTRLRVIPPVDDSGMIFAQSVNHFKMKNEDGFGIALACLNHHAENADDEPCFLCKLVDYLYNSGDKSDAKIAKDIKASSRWYLQAFIAEKGDDGKLSYMGPKLVGLSKTTAEAVSGLLADQDKVGTPLFCDVEQGQDIVITRTGAGLQSRYRLSQTSQLANLDEAIPGWEDKILTDVYDSLNLKIVTPDEQAKIVLATFGDVLDWDAIEEALS